MTEANARSIFEAYLRATNARDIEALESLVAPDFEDFYPQSGETTRGLENLRSIIENYPGGGYRGGETRVAAGSEDRWVMSPMLTLHKIEGMGDTFTGVSRGLYPDGTTWHIVTIGRIRDGRLWRLETYFAQDFDPPEWRRRWVEHVP